MTTDVDRYLVPPTFLRRFMLAGSALTGTVAAVALGALFLTALFGGEGESPVALAVIAGGVGLIMLHAVALGYLLLRCGIAKLAEELRSRRTSSRRRASPTGWHVNRASAAHASLMKAAGLAWAALARFMPARSADQRRVVHRVRQLGELGASANFAMILR